MKLAWLLMVKNNKTYAADVAGVYRTREEAEDQIRAAYAEFDYIDSAWVEYRELGVMQKAKDLQHLRDEF